MARPTVICLTPVKNEAWILERFLEAASLWADEIIIADQHSDDGSRDIAKRFPKVTLIDNPDVQFNESERQTLLLAAARRIKGPRLLIALDADEFLTANCLQSEEWQRALTSEPGTVIAFRWAVVLPDLATYYLFPGEFRLGLMDDGISAHTGRAIHSPRLPMPEHAPVISMEQIRVLHYAVADVERFKSKIRWYQCWEYLNQINRRGLLGLYRWYHRDLAIPPAAKLPLPKQWFEAYRTHGININAFRTERIYRWDRELLEMFKTHGVEHFRRLAIWDVNWGQKHSDLYGSMPPPEIRDPRSTFEKAVHRWLHDTQPYFSHFTIPTSRFHKLYLRTVQKTLRVCGW